MVFCSLFLPLAKKIEAPAQLQELVSDLPSQFVSSPPALRTRQKNPLNTSRRTDGLVRNAWFYLYTCFLFFKQCFLGKLL